MSRRTVAMTGALAIALTLAWPSAAVAAAPTASVVVSETLLRAGQSSLVTFTFSEAVLDFGAGDIIVVNGTLTGLSPSDATTWTATFTPALNVTSSSNVITVNLTGVTDQFGTVGVGTAASNNFAIDTERPTAAVTMSDGALMAGGTSAITFTYSESVAGFTNADITAPNGTLTAVTSADGGITWTATFTPNANVRHATNVITLDLTGVTDLAGNAGAGTAESSNYSISTVRPTATVVVSDTVLAAGETSVVTLTFSEPVSGFSNADITAPNGMLSVVSSMDGGVTWTATFTPTDNTSDSSNVITIDLAGVGNADGNAGTGTASSNNYQVDTRRPTAAVVVSDTVLTAGETTLVTFTFSEPVTGLSNAHITAPNGTLTPVTSTDGGITWRATFTPDADLSVSVNAIVLDLAGVTDLNGNSGVGTVDSNSFAIQTAARPAGGGASLPPTGADVDELMLIGLLLMAAGLTAATTVRRSSAARSS